ncbi:HNH endonuclease [Nocardioides sp. Kera G14]|uniref:HNH endonuclease n=1 Tax=Nocardioides sp. Kera G14 TaxID=2884264 RepID=UPI001D11ABF8|nr:HNH endonuclease signature motif containing protein [Nocardioides sp. Kera G14]UDY23683.1 HNH endonuclease [Nocardioides sp. Kera G14]
MADTPTTDDIRGFVMSIAGPIDGDLDSICAELGELETLKHQIEARQARLALQVDRLLRERAAVQGVPASRQGKGVAELVARSRRISPARGRTVVALAKQLRSLPQTFQSFCAGDFSEHQALVVAHEAAILEGHDVSAFDQRFAATPGLKELGTRKIAHRAQTIALALDEEAVVRRRDKAVENRHITAIPTDRGDGMGWLKALMPIEQLAAVKDSLGAAADTAIALGVDATRSQVMVDTLVARLTGAGSGAETVALEQPAHPVTINLLMTAEALLDNDHTQPALLAGHEPIPTALAKRLIQTAVLDVQKVELRRLFTAPETGELVGMESKTRLFPQALAQFIRLRDQLCRTPGCGARIGHIDHITDWASGGQTSAANAQGYCRQCNWAKQVIGNQHSDPPPLRTQPEPDVRPRHHLVVAYDTDLTLAA